jgi:hypothetical protein
MAKHIGIVGSGFAGLHLALMLQQRGVETTLYTDRSAQQMRNGAPAVLARWASTIAHERELGVNLWDGMGSEFNRFDFFINVQPPMHFPGALETTASFIDPRLYLSSLQQVYVDRGGTVNVGSLNAGDMRVIAEDHDLIVVAAGKGEMAAMFPRIEALSPFSSPARNLNVAYFEGFTTPDTDAVHFVLSPGHGEIIHGSILSFDGVVPGIFFEGVPGGDFDRLTAARYIDNPQAFHKTAIDILRIHAPHLYEGVDPKRFRVISPKNVLQGSLTPVVRQGYLDLGNGKYAVAVGDIHVLNDPLIGQGANTAVNSAWVLGDLILNSDRYDLEFGKQAEAAMWEYARHVVDWSTLMLRPPQPHVLNLIGASSQHPPLASAFANTFHNPCRAEVLQSAEATQNLINAFVTA